MARTRGLLTAATAACLMLMTAGTAHADLTDAELRAVTDDYLYDISLSDFTILRGEKPHADQLDWSSDSCSYSPDDPLGYEFTESCDRHDFGYRNYKAQTRFNEDTRLTIDDNFLADMNGSCGDDSTCRGVATLYYEAVRQFGGSGASTAEAIDQADVTVVTDETGEPAKLTSKNASGEVVEVDVRG